MHERRIVSRVILAFRALNIWCPLSSSLFPLDPTGAPIELIQPETLKFKALEPVLLLGRQRFANLDLRIRVKGGGHVSQIYGECMLGSLRRVQVVDALGKGRLL